MPPTKGKQNKISDLFCNIGSGRCHILTPQNLKLKLAFFKDKQRMFIGR
jgi:hypothetical protein